MIKLCLSRYGYGSSPRVWGKPRRYWFVRNGARFIPTGVGKTNTQVDVAVTVPVHPHGCGENGNSRLSAGMPTGSSPRVWGKRRLCWSHLRFRTVHPHGCGENNASLPDAHLVFGSSPRVWGKRPRYPKRRGFHRFIPTGVGKTGVGAAEDEQPAVHPHGCGENANDKLHSAVGDGSSPRVWGKL